MADPRINGFSVAYVTVGGIVLWSGIKGTTISDTFRSLLQGQLPSVVTEPITGSAPAPANQATKAETQIGNYSGGPVTANTITSIQNLGLARMVASTYGWASGQEWAALTEIINSESGGNPNARNPQSGAYGIAQALGHDPTGIYRGSQADEYGPDGTMSLPASTYQAANSGNATAQLIWMCEYVKERYGDPVKAWSYHVANGAY